jgi:two-component system LytT family sensor kinase
MFKNYRYGFWKVFWVVLGFYFLFTIIGIIAITISPATVGKGFDWHELVTWHAIISQIVKLFFSVVFYWIGVNTYYKLIIEKKGFVEYIKFSVIAAVVLLVFYWLCMLFIPKDQDIQKNITKPLIIFSFILATIFNVGLALLIAYLSFLRDERKQRKVLEAQKMQLEVEKSQANFNFLKAQINPHFLHNTLNFLYAKSLPYSAELSEGILTLSDIMRYALSEANTKDGKAPLKDEIEHVRNVIKINQLRFSNTLNVKFDVEGVVNDAMIIPFVLITLVENAFKHGDLKSTEDPIEVKLNITDGKLFFYCRNKKKSGPKELSTGIGLENIKKRLELAYGKDHSFNVADADGYYTTELTITRL